MRRLITLLLYIIPFVASAQPELVLHKPYAVKFYFIDSLYRIYNKTPTDTTSIEQIDKLRKWATGNDDKELAGELTLFKYKMLLYGKSHPVQVLENELIELEREAETKKLHFLQADVLMLLGFYNWNVNKKHSLAFENYISAYRIYTAVSADEFPPKRGNLYILGTAYYVYEDYENALKYLKEAEGTKPAFPKAFTTPINNNIALCYRNFKKYDSSEFYLKKVLDDTDKQWKTITAGNMGINYYLQHRYDEAVPLLWEDINFSIATNNNLSNAANSIYILSLIHYIRNDIDSAEKLLLWDLKLCEGRRFWPDYGLEVHIFTQLHKIYTKKNNPALANSFADSALVAKDSVDARYNSLNLTKAQEKMEYFQHARDTEQLLNQKNMHELIRNCLVTGILLLTIIGILLINSQRLKQKKLEAEKKIAESDLATAVLKLDGFRQSVQEKNLIIEHFNTEIEKIKKTEEEQVDNELRSQLERATILTDEQWEDFRILFEQVHKGFFGGLKKKYPDLSQAEIRFLALTKMKLTSKEMASMLGISVNAIRMNRHRLRRKLELDKEDMIEELVDNI